MGDQKTNKNEKRCNCHLGLGTCWWHGSKAKLNARSAGSTISRAELNCAFIASMKIEDRHESSLLHSTLEGRSTAVRL